MTKSQKYRAVKESSSRSLEIRGVSYHLLEWGDHRKPAIFLLHGWGDCAASFQFVVDELRQDWFVIAPDWRGFGRSQHCCNGYWFPDYLADLDAILQHYSPTRPVCLVGHSMGANVASLYAGSFPERVRSFINIEGFGLPDSDPQEAPARYNLWIKQNRKLPTFATYTDFNALARRVIRRAPTMSRDRALFVAEQWAFADDDGTIRLRADPAHKLPNAVLYRRAEALACWAGASARVLLVCGEQSEFAAGAVYSAGSALAAAPFRDAEELTISDCGHMIHFEQPARLAHSIEEFLLEAGTTVV